MFLTLNGWRTVLGCAVLLAAVTVQAEDTLTTTDRFIVHYAPSVNAMSVSDQAAQQQALTQHAETITGLDLEHARTLSTGDEVLVSKQSMTLEAAQIYAESLKELPGVLSVEPDVRVKANTLNPNDPLYPQQQYLTAPSSNYLSAINAPTTWSNNTSTPVVVGVLDTGITNHPDLMDNFVGKTAADSGYDFISDASIARDQDARDSNPTDEGTLDTSNWHGTHVAGLVAAVQNQQGITGVSPHTRLLNVRIMGANGGYISDVVDAIYWSIGDAVLTLPVNKNGARVLNLSLGGRSNVCSPTIQQAINTAVSKGVLVVVAAGNAAIPVQQQTPANCDNVIVVGAADYMGYLANFSNYGKAVDLLAPGVDILSTLNSGYAAPDAPNYGSMTGTSMSTALVTGTVASMLASNPHLTDGTIPATQVPALIETKLKQSTRAFTVGVETICKDKCGAGLLDVANAVASVSTAPTVSTTNKEVLINETVVLTAKTSDDPYNKSGLTYEWVQVSGEKVNLLDATTLSATFKAPNKAQTLVFKMTATDDVGLSTSSELKVTVKKPVTPTPPSTPTSTDPTTPTQPTTPVVEPTPITPAPTPIVIPEPTPINPEPTSTPVEEPVPAPSHSSGGGGGSTSIVLLLILGLIGYARRATSF